MEKYVSIGFTKKCHGFKGDLKVQVDEIYLEDFLKSSVVFLLIKGKHVPYFIEKSRFGNELLLKLEEVDSKEAAHPLTSKELFLQAKQILAKEEREVEIESNLEFEKYIGYTILDTELGAIEKIKEIIEYPQQEMATLIYHEKEILIPLHQQLIEKIDDSQQYIYMNLPKGILDL